MRLLPAASALLIGALTVLTPAAAPALERPLACPAAARQQLEGFYRWFLNSGDRYRDSFASQRERFTPRLSGDLQTAFALQPATGRFLDFDPFSNSQVPSYSFRIAGCRRDGSGPLLLRVEVLTGLRPIGASYQPLDYVLTPSGQTWRIADILYPGEPSFRLTGVLRMRVLAVEG
jgi:hypothetical protein